MKPIDVSTWYNVIEFVKFKVKFRDVLLFFQDVKYLDTIWNVLMIVQINDCYWKFVILNPKWTKFMDGKVLSKITQHYKSFGNK